ncbi:cysteine desulfurase family protein [Aporhodopirellula aestuarii]|uniref:cysteine desulfurase n=1 Tax=Aporhodopirellula aestuarii TaxID=2950107 RepID=A0ABT0TY98_9BACT|nr:cysteine desulfurase family protein [Aporhodopirellula aestuarii]MCM2369559.1 cysteine desulfurase [Aporhodopirellula aestuarii]
MAEMIYLDHHATTPCDPRVVDAMLPWFTERFANPHSDSHAAGREAADAIAGSIQTIAETIHAPASALLITSGATESINLAMRGVMTHPRNRRNHMVVCTTEHPAVLDVAADLQRSGVEVSYVRVHPQSSGDASPPGTIDLDALAEAITDQTALVNVMLANNEMGAIHPIVEVARITHEAGALLHCDATQAVGRMPVDVGAMGIDLLSASAHKFYGPKGIGLLVAGGCERRVRLRPQIVGGGQQQGLRSGTMNPAGVIAMATAIGLGVDDGPRIAALRDRLWQTLRAEVDGIELNGPTLSDASVRLAGNLNFRLRSVEGETWMAATPDVAFSSGSACSSANPSASHVLLAMGLSESEARRSVRFGVGRFTTESDIDQACERLIAAYRRF